MKNKLYTLILLSVTVTVSCQTSHEMVDYFTNNGFGNAVGGKSGEYYKGTTYVAYQGPGEDPYVAAYNHKNGEWDGPYKAGTSLLGQSNGKKIDNHGKPTLVVDGKGYIHLVFGGHGGTPDLGKNTLGNYHKGKQTHVVTKKPMDISAWEELDNITPFGTYSQFLKMDNGDIYLFYRHGAHRSNWVYQVSKDNCRTFSPLVSIVMTKKTEAPPGYDIAYDSWYLNFSHGEGNDIIVVYNYHICKGPKHDGERHNTYYMKFDTDNNQWLNVQGEKLLLPITKEHADEMTLVNNSGENWTHNGVAGLNNLNNPHVTSNEGQDDGSVHGGPKQIIHYYWTGKQWVGGNTGLPIGAKGLIKIESPEEVSFLLANSQEKIGEVAWWKSFDSAQSFSKEDVLLSEKGGAGLISAMIRNAHPDAQIIVSQKIQGSDYTKIYLLGDKGPVKRPIADADRMSE